MLACLAIGCAATALAAAAPVQPDAAALRAGIAAAFPDPEVAVAAALVAGDQVQAVEVRGRRTGERVDARTRFECRELARELTAAVALRLAMRGDLRLDDGLGRYFDGVPEPWLELKVRHLMTGASGLAPDVDLGDADVADRAAVVRAMLRGNPLRRPGRGASPVAAEWILLAAVCEQASGSAFDQLLMQQVLMPAGMRDATITATGWRQFGDRGVEVTVHDLAAWCAALHGGRVLDDDARAAFFAADRSLTAPAGAAVRDRQRRVVAFQHTCGAGALVHWTDQRALVLLTDGPADVAAALGSVLTALEAGPEAAPADALAGRYRLDSGSWFEVVSVGEAIELRAAGSNACAHLIHGTEHHPEWPRLYADYEAHAMLHVKPLLKADAASLRRAFAASAEDGAVDRALALVADLARTHGDPGRPFVLGTNSIGALVTWVRVPFGEVEVTLRLRWFSFDLLAIDREGVDLPIAVTLTPEAGRDAFVGRSLDGKNELRVTFRSGGRNDHPRAMLLHDASRQGRRGFPCTRMR